MKKSILISLMAISVASVMSSCTKEISSVSDSESAKSVRIVASGIDTKTQFSDLTGSEYPVVWTANQDVEFSLAEATPVKGTMTISEANPGKATFDVEFASTPADGDIIYGFSPMGKYVSYGSAENKAGFNTIGADYNDVYLNLPSEQTPLVNSCDEAAQAIAGEATYSSESASTTMHFSHVVAYGKMTISNLDKEISSVVLEFPTNVVGSSCHYYYADYTNGETTTAKGTLSNMSSSIITLDASKLGASKDFWFALAPVGTLSDGTLTAKVYTTDGLIYVKEINLTSEKSIKFEKGNVTNFTLNMSGVTPITATFTFSTIATRDSWTNSTAYTSVTKDDNGNEGITLTAIGGGNNGKYYTSNDSYRMYTGGTLKISATNSNVCITKILINSNISSTMSVETGTLSGNTWTGGSNEITIAFSGTTQIFSITIWSVEAKPQTLSFDESSVTINIGSSYTQAVKGANTSVEYSSSDSSIASVDENGQVSGLKEGTVTITAKAVSSDTYAEGTATYTVTVVDQNKKTITITCDDFKATSYSTSETTFTKDGTSFGYVSAMINNNNNTPAGWAKQQVIQVKASEGIIYNKSEMAISSIRVYLAVNTNTFTIAYGTTTDCSDGSISRPTTSTGTEDVAITTYSAQTTSSGTTTLNYYDFDLSSKDAKFFTLSTGSKVIYIYKLVITY